MTERNSPSDHNETLPPDSTSDLETLPPRPIPSDSSIQGLSGDFGRYKIQALLGQGGMGAVYLALDTQLDRLVALKTPRFENDKDGELLQRFYREAKTAGTVRHPNICPVYAVEELNGRPFMAMAYIEGRPLSDYINPEKPRTERQALVVIRKLALAIQDAHDHGIIHRDLKPANVMIDKRGEPIVMDFGLARQIEIEQDSRITTTGVVMGSPAYMAPEQVDGDFGTVGPPTDQYALGVILYEMLTGNVPFRGSVAAIYGKIVTRAPIPPRRLRPRLDPRVDALAMRMMSKRPSERFPTMKAVAEAAQEILLNPPEKASGKTTATGLKRRTPAEVAAMVVAANKLIRQHQYEKAVELLEQVAADDRTAELNGVLEQALELNDEVTFLTARLLNAWTKETYKDEIASVRRLLELVPGHSLGQKILDKIEADAESWWAGISFSAPLGLSGLSSIAQWSLFVTVVFIVTFGTMVYYYDLANSSLKSVPLISRDGSESSPDQSSVEPPTENGVAVPEKTPVSTNVRYTGMKKIKRLAKLPLAFIYTVSVTDDARKILVSGVPARSRQSLDASFLLDVPSGNSKVIPDGWGYSTILPNGNQAALLSIRKKPPGQKTNYFTDLSLVDLDSGNALWQEQKAHDHLCYSLAATADSRVLLTGGMDNTKAWDLVDRKLLWTKNFPGYDINFDRGGTGTLLISIMANKLSRAENFMAEKLQTVPLPSRGTYFNALDTRRDILIAGLNVLQASDFKPRWILDETNPSLHSISLFPEGRHLLSSASSGDVTIWSLDSGQKEFSIRLEAEAKDPKIGKYGLQAILAGDGKTVITFPPQYIGLDRQTQLLGPMRGEDPWIDIWQLESEPVERTANPPPLLAAPEKFIAPVVKPPEELKAPFNLATAQAAQRAWGEYLKQPVEYANSLGMKIRLIPPGRFRMGSLESMEETLQFDKENGVAQPKVAMFEDEFPPHEVHITPFGLGTTEVTLKQFKTFVDATKYVTQSEKNQNGQGYVEGKLAPERAPQFSFRNIGVPQGDDEPVVNVSRDDALAFCDWLSKKEQRKYRLPYEAEWEYACRAGTITRFSCGDDPQELIKYANVGDAAARSRFTNWKPAIRGSDGYVLTAPVGKFLPNSFGLHDLHGNVWELCQDVYGPRYYDVSQGEQTPQGPPSGTDHVIRGGCYSSLPHSDRSSMRQNSGANNADCNMGFRVALEIPSPVP